MSVIVVCSVHVCVIYCLSIIVCIVIYYCVFLTNLQSQRQISTVWTIKIIIIFKYWWKI